MSKKTKSVTEMAESKAMIASNLGLYQASMSRRKEAVEGINNSQDRLDKVLNDFPCFYDEVRYSEGGDPYLHVLKDGRLYRWESDDLEEIPYINLDAKS